MKTLIISHDKDHETAAVAWGLKKLGIEVQIWSTVGPEKEQYVTYESIKNRFLFGSQEFSLQDVVWIRRPQSIVLHKAIDEMDRKFVLNESTEMVRCALQHLGSAKLCINPYNEESIINRKTSQLQLAQSIGFYVPSTVVTNNPNQAKDFVNKSNHRVIYKNFLPHMWRSESGKNVAINYANLITAQDLADNFFSESCPLILQEYIEKIYDARVVVMGKALIAAKVTACRNRRNAPIDWRTGSNTEDVHVESISIPEKVQSQIFEFMERSGLVFGSFDFSIDANNQWWFLEINPAGQFLWLEHINKNLKVLPMFCSFLASGDKDYNGDIYNVSLTHESFRESNIYKSLVLEERQKSSELLTTIERG